MSKYFPIGVLFFIIGCALHTSSNKTMQTEDFLGEYVIDSTTNPCFTFYDSLSNQTLHVSPNKYIKRIMLSKKHTLLYYNVVQNDNNMEYRDKNGNRILYTRRGHWQTQMDTLVLNFESDKKIEHYLIRPDSLISVNKSKKQSGLKNSLLLYFQL